MSYTTLEEVKTVGRISSNSLILGDCLEAMDYLSDASVDLILADLPYE